LGLHLVGITILCSILLGLAALVLAHNRHAYVNNMFALSTFTIVGWIISISLALTTPALDHTVVLSRFAFAFATAMPFTLLSLFCEFSAPPGARTPAHIKLLGVACVAFAVLSFTPYIVAGAGRGDLRPNLIYGPLHPYLGLYTMVCLAWALVVLARGLRSATGIRRLQLRYLLLGVLGSGVGVVTTNFLIPLLWKTSRYSVVGPYFTLVFVSFAAHAIIRHRLMDIRVFVKQSVVYGLAIFAIAAMFVCVALVVAFLTGQPHDALPLSVALAMALLISLLFQPLKTRLHAALNRYLYRQAYDYHRIVREVSRTLNSTLELTHLLDSLADALDTTLRPETVRIYLRTEPYRTFEECVTRNVGSTSVVPSDFGVPSLVLLLQRQRSVLYADNERDTRDEMHQRAITDLRRLNGEIAFPFVSTTELLGFVVLSAKRSGDPYFDEDLDLVSTLVSQASVGIRNAQLYSEILLANEYIENILVKMESAVVAVSADGLVTLFNPAAEQMTQLSAFVVKGAALRLLPQEIADPLQATLNDGRTRTHFETTIADKTGRIAPVMCSTSTLRDKAGHVLGAVGVFSDLSDLKQLETDKRRAERLASIGALSAGIAHEIKNPLVAIKTFAELLPERFAEEDFRGNFSKIVIKEIDRIDGLVDRLRGMAAPRTQHLQPLDLRVPLQETLALLRVQLEQAGIMVTTSLCTELFYVAGDLAQLKQLFLNLLVNAIEAMSGGGALSVRLRVHDPGNPQHMVVEIQDTGSGIPEHLLATMFDPFITTKPRGSGLGLSISRGIADAHRATIHARNNTVGGGATMTVEFPVLHEVATTTATA
jgi:PAS domain S-box-containing protein